MANRKTKVLEKINGHGYPIMTIGLVLTAIGIGVAILVVALDTREKIGKIEMLGVANMRNITKAERNMKEETSRIEMGGCRPANENAVKIARLGAK